MSVKTSETRSSWITLLLIFGLMVAPGAVFAQDEAEPAATETAEVVAEPDDEEEPGLGDRIAAALDSQAEKVNNVLAPILFWSVTGDSIKIDKVDRDGNPVLDDDGDQVVTTVQFPLIVVVLVFGSIFFTFFYRFINFRGFFHALQVVRGKYDDPEAKGEISHFKALTSALSATVGLGNIAGVAVAIQLGGPGALFWMVSTALFGMTAKFSSCTLAQLYRQTNADGSISGGPMYYLDLGLAKMGPGWGKLGKVLAVTYAVLLMLAAMGGGNMFQSNQAVSSLVGEFDALTGWEMPLGLILTALVGAVILGGIKRIGSVTAWLVPWMCGIYVAACLFVIIRNIGAVPESIALVVKLAFSENAFFGGMAGVLVQGVKRAAFSNEAGLGSAAIAHAAAKTKEPVREGMVAMIGPFIDTVVICSMTALVMIITGVWNDPANDGQTQGVLLTQAAFSASKISWFSTVLSVSIFFFAYSTMISWCYYGERGWIYLLDHFDGKGLQSVNVFRITFCVCVFLGAMLPLGAVIDFADMLMLALAFPNVIGSIILAPKVLPLLKDYWGRYQAGELKVYK